MECEKTFYVPPVLKKNSKTSKSERLKEKLIDKYRNKLTFIRGVDNLKNDKVVLADSTNKGKITIMKIKVIE